MHANSPAAEFAEIATVELDALTSFVVLLEQERSALEQSDADALPEIAAAKSDLMETLSHCAAKRMRIFDAAEFPADSARLTKFLAGEPQALEVWEKVIAAARRASELNTGNGFIVSQRLSHVNRALGMLGGPRSSLYDTTGIAAHGVNASRSLARV